LRSGNLFDLEIANYFGVTTWARVACASRKAVRAETDCVLVRWSEDEMRALAQEPVVSAPWLNLIAYQLSNAFWRQVYAGHFRDTAAHSSAPELDMIVGEDSTGQLEDESGPKHWAFFFNLRNFVIKIK